MKFRVVHLTRYEYAEPVSLCHSIAHLKPLQTRRQRCLASQLRVDPWPAVMREREDFFGNRVNYFSIQQAHSVLEVIATSEVDVNVLALPDADKTPTWERVVTRLYDRGDALMTNARMFTLPSPQVPLDAEAREFAAVSFTAGRPILEATLDLMGRIFREFEYDPLSTTVATPLAEVMQQRRGVCQDFAHVAIAGLRGLGLAARYVSGYLETLPPPGQIKLQGADASHAWFAVLIPELGWVDFDPTNNQTPNLQYITTAVGRDFQDVTPLRGIFYGGGTHDLRVAVDVNRLEQPAPSV
ncbi:transglutaminase family protein [Chromatium okenii]|jgi:transglutaminase-like putative cysteine protease|uniref:Transglutaminase n=1 Tax=Chromatium okenii TaxID=61644 RepID=A0A2S7XP13_9GAMM|nr:transglutaminase family protein [Chromatium okenii]MBV5308141.1 transglutaminase family protein [Chromatium okenii]PQJ95474.1 transglutaminase [Chromatium okenii]